MNYRKDDQSFITMKEILKDYQVNYPEKENFELQVHELGIILKEVFPDVERVQQCYQLGRFASFCRRARLAIIQFLQRIYGMD